MSTTWPPATLADEIAGRLMLAAPTGLVPVGTPFTAQVVPETAASLPLGPATKVVRAAPSLDAEATIDAGSVLTAALSPITKAASVATAPLGLDFGKGLEAVLPSSVPIPVGISTSGEGITTELAPALAASDVVTNLVDTGHGISGWALPAGGLAGARSAISIGEAQWSLTYASNNDPVPHLELPTTAHPQGLSGLVLPTPCAPGQATVADASLAATVPVTTVTQGAVKTVPKAVAPVALKLQTRLPLPDMVVGWIDTLYGEGSGRTGAQPQMQVFLSAASSAYFQSYASWLGELTMLQAALQPLTAAARAGSAAAWASPPLASLLTLAQVVATICEQAARWPPRPGDGAFFFGADQYAPIAVGTQRFAAIAIVAASKKVTLSGRSTFTFTPGPTDGNVALLSPWIGQASVPPDVELPTELFGTIDSIAFAPLSGATEG